MLRRWFQARGAEPAAGANASGQTTRSPVPMAAVDVAGAEAHLLDAVRNAVQRPLQIEPGARLARVAVMKTNRVGMDEWVEKDGSSKHADLLVQLKPWARSEAAGCGATLAAYRPR